MSQAVSLLARIPEIPLRHVRPCARIGRVLGAAAWAAAAPLRPVAPSPTLHRWAQSALRHLGIVVEIQGLLHRQAPLWVANHLSWLDPVVLLSLRPMGVLAKQDVAGYPLIGPASARLGLSFVDRTNPLSRALSVIRLARDLQRGLPTLLFPEGTTTSGARLAPLHTGGLKAAYRCGSALQPLCLTCEDPDYPWIADDELMPHLVKIARKPSLRVRLRAGSLLEPRRFASEQAWIDAISHQLTPHS